MSSELLLLVSSISWNSCMIVLQCTQSILYCSTFISHDYYYIPVNSHTIHQLHTLTHTLLTALFPGLPRQAGTRNVKPMWIFLKQETVSGSVISWATCKSASRSRQITMSVPHHTKFFTGWMPFLPPNQQRQSTAGNTLYISYQYSYSALCFFSVLALLVDKNGIQSIKRTKCK